MGCSYSAPIGPTTSYIISYCTLVPLSSENVYKIKLISKEEVKKRRGRKFFEQVNRHKEKEITNFMKRQNFEEKTLFYIYCKNRPQIKNLYQMMNLIPREDANLHDIFLLNTESVDSFPNNLIEKKTQNIPYYDFVGYEMDLNDMEDIYDDMNYSHITRNNIIYDDDKIEEEDERRDEIYINGAINRQYVNYVEHMFLKKKEIKKVYISEIKIENKKSFVDLISFFSDKDIKVFSIFNTSINAFDSKIIDSIIQLLEKNYNLRSIDLHNCNLRDNNLNNIMLAISDKRIRYLDLRKNSITEEGATVISELFLQTNKTLVKFNLSNNDKSRFKADGVKFIIKGLFPSPCIKYVDFSEMNITGCGEFIYDLLLEKKCLESLILRNNSLNSKDFKYIFEGIKLNKTIKEIDISRNDMGGDKMYEYIRDGIKKNTSLVLFRMDKINIGDDNYDIIFDGIKNNQHIDKYSFCYNPVDPKIVFEFFMSQKQVKKLRYLPHEDNKEFTLEEKKLIEKCKSERPDLYIINF